MKQCHFDRALRYKRTVKVSVQNGLFFFCLINYGVSHFQFIKFLALQSIVKVEADNSAWNEIKLIGGRICSSVGLIVVCVHTNNKRCDPGCNKKGKLSKIWLNSFWIMFCQQLEWILKKLTTDRHSSGNAVGYIHESSANFVGIWVSRSNGWALIEISNSSSARDLIGRLQISTMHGCQCSGSSI